MNLESQLALEIDRNFLPLFPDACRDDIDLAILQQIAGFHFKGQIEEGCSQNRCFVAHKQAVSAPPPHTHTQSNSVYELPSSVLIL